MKSIISSVLFGVEATHKSRGRVIKFDTEEPTIELATGTMEERIILLLKQRVRPLKGSEIAMGISSNTSRVTKSLKALIAKGAIVAVDVPGCVKEYSLKRLKG